MMIKCQKCGFENQMGSIFCRECGEKLNMDAIDPNKLQKDVNKEKNIKLAKKRVKSAISAAISVLIVGGFIFAIIYRGWEDNKDYSVVEETESDVAASAQKKFNDVMRGTTVGKVKYTYPELNYMFRDQVVKPLYELDSFAKIVSFEMGFNEEKNLPVANIWLKIKDKVPVRYVVYGDIIHTTPDPDNPDADILPIDMDVKRLDIGLIPLFVSTHTFLNGLSPLLDNEAMRNFFRRAQSVEFTADGLNVEFAKGGPAPVSSMTPSSNKPSSATAVAALKGGSAAASEKDEAAREAARQKAEEKKQKAAEEAEKKKALEEERKRKAEEEAQRRREKEEERKRKAEEEKERKKQEAEERRRRQEEENQRRRDEAEQRRRDRENDRYNNRNSSRNNRNNRW